MSARPALAAVVLALALASAAPPARAQTGGSPSLVDSARTAAANVWSGAQDIAIFALGLIGVDYRWGGESPEDGLDCSGLVRHAFQQVTGFTLPRTSREMSRLGRKVGTHELKAGDLVFFNTRRFAYSHVGIYLGDDRFIHAPSRGSEVEIAELSNGYWRKHFSGARRLVGVLPGLVPDAEAAAPAAR